MTYENIKLRSAIICDEVRQEMDGRAIILGARFLGKEVPEEGGKIDRLAVYIEAEVINCEKVSVRLWTKKYEHALFVTSFEPPKRAEFEETYPDVDYEKASFAATIVSNGAQINAPGPGEYVLQMKPDEEKDWSDYLIYYFPEPDDA